jgi:nicotinamidase-related amidase
MYAHAELGKIFGIPVVMSTSAETGTHPEHTPLPTWPELTWSVTGPNGPLPDEFLESYPDVKVVRRQGEVNAWDNAEFREAVKATKKSQIVLAGIVTDVCK